MRRVSRSRAFYLLASAVYAVVVYVAIELLFTAELVQAGLLAESSVQAVFGTARIHILSFVLFVMFSLIAALIASKIAAAVSAALTVEERRASELAIVSGLASRLSGRRDVAGIATESLAAVRQVLPPSTTAGYLEFEDESSSFRIAAEDGPSAGAIRGNWYPIAVLPEAIRQQVILDRRRLVLQDTRAEGPVWDTLATRFTALAEARSFALLPLVSSDRMLGAMMLRDERPEMLAPSRIDMVALLAQTITGALGNARSIAEAEARADREGLVNRVAQTARSSLNPTEVLRRTVEELGKTMGVSRAGIVLGAAPDDLRLAQEWTAEGVTTLGQGSQRVPVARLAAREGKTIVIQDTDLDERLHPDPMAQSDLRESRSRSVIASPISIAGKLVGVLVLSQTITPRTWTGDEVRLVEAVTHELRVAMEAARLFQARQRENERMLALHHASAVLAGQTDPRVILEEILKNAVRLLGLGGASLYIYVPEAKILRNIRDYQVREAATEKMLRPGKGMAGTAFARIAPVIQNDYLAWEGATVASKAAGQRAAIAVPLVRSGQPIGAIVVRSYDPSIRFTDEDGHLLTLFADQAVSALSAAEAFEQQRAAVEELERLSKAKSDFISIVSHEFRTPLTGIQGFSEMMRDEQLTPAEIHEFSGDINKDAQRLNRMITDMLDLDRMESGRMVLHREAVDINAVINDVVDRVRPNSPRHPIHLRLDPRLPEFSGDRDKLTQVVSNLVSNSVKYSPDGGEIAITTRAEPGFVHVAIEDHGLGIPSDALELVFDRYSRIDSSATRHIQGTGLGLPIVRQIVEMHGGRVWAESIVGKGSIFRFTVPLAAVPQAV